MTDHVPTSSKSSESAAAQRRQQFWAKVIVIIVIVAVAILKPKVEAWLNQRAGNPIDIVQTDPTASDSTATNRPDVPGDSAGAGLDDLGTLTISDPDDAAAEKPNASETALPGANRKSTSKKSKSETGTGAVASETSVASRTNGSSTPVATESKTESPKNRTTKRTDVTQTAPQPRSDTKPGASGKATSDPEVMNPDKPSSSGTKSSDTKPSGTKSSGTKTTDSKTKAGKPKTVGPKLATPEASAESVPGKLTLIKGSRDVFVSTAGLKYVSGSQDGHRLKHVLQHAEDNLDKPIHGVYAGDRDQILAWIDIAYTKGQKGGKGTRTEEEGGRTVYTVDLGEKIGYVCGQVGKRRNNPPCRFLRLVVQNGNEVVTAFPAESM